MGNFLLSIPDWNISAKRFRINLPQIFNIQILIISWPWVLFGPRFVYDFSNAIFSKRDHREAVVCFFKMISKNLVVLLTTVHSLEKKLLNISAFLLRSVIWFSNFHYDKLMANLLFIIWKRFQYPLVTLRTCSEIY